MEVPNNPFFPGSLIYSQIRERRIFSSVGMVIKFWLSTHEATKHLILLIYLAYEASENLKWFSVLLSSHSAIFLEVTHAVVGGVLRFLSSMAIFVL